MIGAGDTAEAFPASVSSHKIHPLPEFIRMAGKQVSNLRLLTTAVHMHTQVKNLLSYGATRATALSCLTKNILTDAIKHPYLTKHTYIIIKYRQTVNILFVQAVFCS